MELLNNQKVNFNVKAGSISGDKFFHICCWLFLVCFFFTPDGFGFYLGFLFNAKRIFMFMLYGMIIFNKKRLNQFWQDVKSYKVINIVLGLYMFVRIYTAVYRTSLKSFTNDFLDVVLVLYIFLYLLKHELSVVKLQKIIENGLLVLSIFAVIEFSTGFNFFSLLDTADQFITEISRLNSARVTSICRHAIITGWYFSFLGFFTCIDFEKNKLYLFRRPIHFLLSMIVIFMTGSRAPIGLFFVGIVLILIFSNKDQLIKSLIIIAILLIIFSFVIIVTYNTSFAQYILRMITSAIDGVFGTTLSYQFGGERFIASTEYREALKKVFYLDYFNKFIGRGVGYELSVVIDGYWLMSCDNAYVGMYIIFAYPGLITFILLLLLCLIYMAICFFKYKNRAAAGLMGIFIPYVLLIWNVALMGSFMCIMAILAIVYTLFINEKQKRKGEDNAIENYQRRIRH